MSTELIILLLLLLGGGAGVYGYSRCRRGRRYHDLRNGLDHCIRLVPERRPGAPVSGPSYTTEAGGDECQPAPMIDQWRRAVDTWETADRGTTMGTIQDLTAETVEAVCSSIVSDFQQHGRRVPDDQRREGQKVYELFESSRFTQDYIQGLLRFMKSDPHSSMDKTKLLCAQMFLMGWHARGATDDARTLSSL